MSSFNYEDCHLTYFVSVGAGLFNDEIAQALSRAISPICTQFKLVVTDTVTELITSSKGTQNTTLSIRGFYCIIIFKTDEDRSMFKLTVPNNDAMEELVIKVLQH